MTFFDGTQNSVIRNMANLIQSMSRRLKNLETYELPRLRKTFPSVVNVPAGGFASQTLSVPIRVTESWVSIVTHDSAATNDILMSSHVESAGNVRVVFFNPTGSLIALNGDVTVHMWK